MKTRKSKRGTEWNMIYLCIRSLWWSSSTTFFRFHFILFSFVTQKATLAIVSRTNGAYTWPDRINEPTGLSCGTRDSIDSRVRCHRHLPSIWGLSSVFKCLRGVLFIRLFVLGRYYSAHIDTNKQILNFTWSLLFCSHAHTFYRFAITSLCV